MLARLAHTMVFVADLGRVVEFYATVFDWTRESLDDGLVVVRGAPAGAGLALHRVAAEILGAIATPPVWREDTALKVCIEVDDLDAACRRVVASGGAHRAAWSWRGQRFCECADPEGNVFQVFEVIEPPTVRFPPTSANR